MSLRFSHKPNYFLFAQLLVRHIQDYVQKHPNISQVAFDLRDIHALFQEDHASSSINLDGIMNIADEYKVETLNGDEKLISRYAIDAKNNSLLIDFNTNALAALKNGKDIIAPDASVHE